MKETDLERALQLAAVIGALNQRLADLEQAHAALATQRQQAQAELKGLREESAKAESEDGARPIGEPANASQEGRDAESVRRQDLLNSIRESK